MEEFFRLNQSGVLLMSVRRLEVRAVLQFERRTRSVEILSMDPRGFLEERMREKGSGVPAFKRVQT